MPKVRSTDCASRGSVGPEPDRWQSVGAVSLTEVAQVCSRSTRLVLIAVMLSRLSLPYGFVCNGELLTLRVVDSKDDGDGNLAGQRIVCWMNAAVTHSCSALSF